MRPAAWLAVLASCLILRNASAQTSMDGGARAAALGGSHTALAEEAAGYANPASWATLPGRAVTFFATQAFGLAALRLASIHYAEPTPLGTFTGGLRTFGYDDYRETHLLVGYARGFRVGTQRRFHLGVGARLQRITIPGYGSAASLGLAAGGFVTMLPVLRFGFQATNVHQPKLAGHDVLPRTLALGLAYHPDPSVLIVADVLKDLRFPLALRAGLEVRPVEVLFLRLGYTSAPARFTAGAGLRLGRLAVDFAGERHDALGWSPAVSLGLRW